MNYLKKSSSVLLRLLRYKKPAVRPRAPLQTASRSRCQHISAETPEVLHSATSSRGLFRQWRAVFRLPPTQAAALPRYYHNSPRRPELIHFTQGRGGFRWYHDWRKVAARVLIPASAAAAVYYCNLEAVPYTNRAHFVILPPWLERKLGEMVFDDIKEELAAKILPPLHRDSVRVRRITTEIVRAAHRSLAGRLRSDLYADDASYGGIFSEDASVAAMARRDKEVLDCRSVTESRNKVKARGVQPMTRHLDGLDWEVIVVKDKEVNAMCVPGGKIVVYTGLLDYFTSDAEIASVIGHEVGHVIARHSAEKICTFAILKIVIRQIINTPYLIHIMSTLLFELPFSRRMEIEADLIGIMLLAAAGFDPHIAVAVEEKLGKITRDSALQNYLSTHPSSKKRVQFLSQDKVMEEALELYREVSADKEPKGYSRF